MSENRLFWGVLALLVGSIILVGLINGQDIKACQQAGNSLETCYTTINP